MGEAVNKTLFTLAHFLVYLMTPQYLYRPYSTNSEITG